MPLALSSKRSLMSLRAAFVSSLSLKVDGSDFLTGHLRCCLSQARSVSSVKPRERSRPFPPPVPKSHVIKDGETSPTLLEEDPARLMMYQLQ